MFSTRKAKEEKYGVNKWEKHKFLGGNCGRCGKGFGLVSIRHHCRKCGVVICGDCQHSSRLKLSGSSNEKIVCQVCAADLDGNSPGITSEIPWHTTSSKDVRGACPTLDEFTFDCKICGEKIFGQTITLADGNTRLHADCFICCVDAEKIQGGYAEVDGNIYCAEHYEELYCASCGGCSQKIVEGLAVEAMGQSWHGDCFVCSMCRSPLSVGSSCAPDGSTDMPQGDDKVSFNFYLHNGAMYCAKDFQEHALGKCSGCGFVVESGVLVKAMGASWHQECFVCTECKEPFVLMNPPSYCVHNGRPYCENHRPEQATGGSLTGAQPEERTFPSLRSMQSLTTPKYTASLLVGSSNVTAVERGACLAHGIFQAHMSEPGENGIGPSRFCDTAFKKHQYLDFEDGCEDYKAPFHLEVFAHDVFKDLRLNAFGVSDEEYRNSIGSRPLSGGGKGEGKSGNLFFFSWDRKYIIKTVDNEEVPFFQTCLRDYHRHMIKEKQPETGVVTRSFLPRFFGFYVLKLHREPVLRVVVMANVFPPEIDLVEKYDLKGVLGSKRFVSEEEQEEGVSVLKDRNFMSRTVAVGEHMKTQLLHQLDKDVKFLQDHGRMDYSLLLGIANLADVPNTPQGWPSHDWHGLQSLAQPQGMTSEPSMPWGKADGKVDEPFAMNPARDEVFFMGIIDILEEYTAKKAVEGALKSLRHQATHLLKTSQHATKATAVSAVSAKQYGTRFLEFLSKRIE